MQHSEFRTWHSALETTHSNFKELKNLVNAVENALKKDLLLNCELFKFTDNFVAECVYYNGGSNINKDLNVLVFRLYQLRMEFDFTLYLYHVAGARMIAAGVDGLSRDDKSEGVSGRGFLPRLCR